MPRIGKKSAKDSTENTTIAGPDPIEPTEELPEDEPKTEVFTRPTIPAPPSNRLRVDKQHEFFNYMQRLRPEHWNGLLMYLYRWEPKINAQLRPDGTIDQKANKSIDAIGKSIDEDWILREHGSGMYQFVLKQGEKTVLIADVDMDNPEFPAKVNIWQVDMTAFRNRPYIRKWQAEGKLTPDGKPAAPPEASKTEGQTATEMLSKVTSQLLEDRLRPKESGDSWHLQTLKVITDVYTAAQQGIGKADDPAKLLALVTALKDFTKPIELPKLQDNTPLYQQMLEMQNKAHEAQMQFMNRLLEMQAQNKKNEPEGGILGSLEQLGKLKDGLETLGIGGEGHSGGGKKSIVEIIATAVAPMLHEALRTVNLVLLRSSGVQPQMANPGALAAGTGAIPGTETQENQPMEEVNMENVVAQYSPMLLGAVERGVTGYSFAATVHTMLGNVAYMQIAAMGEEKILAILKAQAALWARLAPFEEKLKAFIHEFIDWQFDEDDTEDDSKPPERKTKKAKES